MDASYLVMVLLFGPCAFGFSIVEEGVGQEVGAVVLFLLYSLHIRF